MKKLCKPFKALLANPMYAQSIVSPPYDVPTRQEAKALAMNNPHSFLHITRSEINLDDGVKDNDERVYAQSKIQFEKAIQTKLLLHEQTLGVYPYQIAKGTFTQTGIIALFSLEAYRMGRIAKHELIKPDKEKDRAIQLNTLQAQPSPVLLTVPTDKAFNRLLNSCVAKPLSLEVVDSEGYFHRLWKITDSDLVQTICLQIESCNQLFIADGHHRTSAANNISEHHSPIHNDRFDYFLAGLFPAEEMIIQEYNRGILPNLGISAEQLLASLQSVVALTACEKPKFINPGHCAVCILNRWYIFSFNQSDNKNPVDSLDVSKLSQQILSPLFGISDLRKDTRIEFIGGKSFDLIEAKVRNAELLAGFALHPTPIHSMIEVSRAGELMPPKSTWFTPKLLDGLLVHCY